VVCDSKVSVPAFCSFERNAFRAASALGVLVSAMVAELFASSPK